MNAMQPSLTYCFVAYELCDPQNLNGAPNLDDLRKPSHHNVLKNTSTAKRT